MPDEQKVLFVCEHGTAKSVVAAAYFDKIASEVGISLRALARGTDPDEAVSSVTVSGLKRDGLKPAESTPQKLSQADLDSACRIISFCELPAEYKANVPVEHWDDVPPVSQNYEQARDAIVAHIRALLPDL